MRHTILAVDDNEQNRAILQELLSEEFEIMLAKSGDEALEVARCHLPELVLLDVNMPGKDGFETCALLRQMRELDRTKIAMLSARTELSDRLHGYDVGADDYITKPFDEQEVLAKVRVLTRLKSESEVTYLRETISSSHNMTEDMIDTLSAMQYSETESHSRRVRRYCRILAEQLRDNEGYDGIINDHFLSNLDRTSTSEQPATMLHGSGLLDQTSVDHLPDFESTEKDPYTTVKYLEQSIAAFWREELTDSSASSASRVSNRSMSSEGPCESTELTSRIVALVKVFDALTTPTNYQEAMSPESARELIIRVSGGQFDQTIIRAFVDAFNQFVTVFEEDGYNPTSSAFSLLNTLQSRK